MIMPAAQPIISNFEGRIFYIPNVKERKILFCVTFKVLSLYPGI